MLRGSSLVGRGEAFSPYCCRNVYLHQCLLSNNQLLTYWRSYAIVVQTMAAHYFLRFLQNVFMLLGSIFHCIRVHQLQSHRSSHLFWWPCRFCSSSCLHWFNSVVIPECSVNYHTPRYVFPFGLHDFPDFRPERYAACRNSIFL